MEVLDDLVTLQIQGTPLKCSRSTLIENSDYFRAMFDGNYVESRKSEITLKDVELEAVTTIMKVLWDQEYIIPESSLTTVLQAAAMLQFLTVKEICLDKIERILSPTNCLKFWVHTERLGLKETFCKAKLMSLIEFKKVRNTPNFFELNLDEITNYLGNVNLQCINEFTVFDSIIQWYSNLDHKNTDTLLQLLKCINFVNISVEEINQMVNVVDNEHVIDIMRCTSTIKSGQALAQFSKRTVDYASLLLSCKERNLNGFPCILVDSVEQEEVGVNSTVLYCDRFKRKRKYNVLENNQANNFVVVYIDMHTRSLKRLFDIESFKCDCLTGFKVTGYKNLVYFYGGEYLLGKGNWNNNIHVYDVIKEEWKSFELKYPRRHFESCVCGKYLFIVGGTGSFRVIQENLFWYDLEQDEWSSEINLPCSGRQLKCCRFQNQLFVLDIINKCGYIFCPCDGNKKWKRLEICNEENLPPFSNILEVFSYKSNLYIKAQKLYQFKLESGKLALVNVVPIPSQCDDAACHIESVLSNGVLYSLKRETNEDGSKKTTVELLNVDTNENAEIWCSNNDSLTINNETFKFKSSLVIFNVFHPNLIDRNDLIG